MEIDGSTDHFKRPKIDQVTAASHSKSTAENQN